MEATTTTEPQSGERIEFKALREPTICAAFQVTAAEHADRTALRTKGDEFSMTWAEYADKVRALAAGLAGLGLKRGDTIALLLTNRPEFHWVDMAAMHLGATPFSIYNTYSAEQIEYLVSDAQNPIVVTEQQYLGTISKVKDKCSSIEHVVVVDGEAEGALSLDDVEARGEDGFDFEAAWKAVEPDDVLTLIYTSGTTGPPKGVQITHENELAAGRSFDQIIQFPEGARAVSYLPMAHIAERSCTHYLPIMFGFTVTCCPDARQIIGYLPEVIEFFHAMGLPLAELWGMSETCGAGTCNRPEHIKIGTVGPPAPGIEVKLAEDGEVLVRGGVVMKGYRNQPDKTEETFTDDGFLMTGDVGEFDDDGFLKIVDRKKELIINAAGKNMSPANIEAKLKTSSPLIGQAVAIGDGRPFNTALITLDPDAAPGFAREHGLEGKSIEELAGEDAVIEAVQEGVNHANEDLARVEQIKKFKLLPTDWEPGGEELTPTMKLKRKPIAEKYKDEIEALYAK